MQAPALRRRLLDWYERTNRALPWRKNRDPYRVWVAEVMLQQTRIQAVVPSYERFLRAFPTVQKLARADVEQVLSQWSGLGYYSRARALHRAAVDLSSRKNAVFPDNMVEARKLPGVGPYTAAAVLSIAYDQPYAAVDGNVSRVLSRLARLPLPDPQGQPHARLAEELLERRRPGDWNQAVMQLGQLVCLPSSPRCDTCPVERFCEAHRTDETSLYPPRRQRRTIERRRLRVRLLHDRWGRILLSRGEFSFLPHLWLPPILIQPNDKVVPGRSPGAKAPVTKAPITFRHAIQHREFEVEVRAKLLPAAELRRRARTTSRTRSTVERRVFAPETLATVGRSALLTKSLRQLPAVNRRRDARERS